MHCQELASLPHTEVSISYPLKDTLLFFHYQNKRITPPQRISGVGLGGFECKFGLQYLPVQQQLAPLRSSVTRSQRDGPWVHLL